MKSAWEYWFLPVMGLMFIITLLMYGRAYVGYLGRMFWYRVSLWRFHVTSRREDVSAARRWLDEIAQLSRRPPWPIWVELNRALLLSVEGHYRDARTMIERLGDKVPLSLVTHRDNLLAWCLAHDGEPDRAIELARSCLKTAGSMTPYIHGTLGAALVLGGHAADAIPHLEKALAYSGDRRAQAIRAYYLGEALRAHGRLADARAAFARAVGEAPATRYGRLAAESLDRIKDAPYRGA